jgi:two-component sensor histidine kinase
MPDSDKTAQISRLLGAPDLVDALESNRFKQFLDEMPIAIAVAELAPQERIVYANLEFERLSSLSVDAVIGKDWDVLDCASSGTDVRTPLGAAVVGGQDHIGVFTMGADSRCINVWSHVIEDDNDKEVFRLVALAAVRNGDEAERAAIIAQLEDKDVLLRELQHRVKNNLQMITALIRLESRNLPEESEVFGRLAGRVEALALLYHSLSEEGITEEIDLGVYLSQIAGAVMRAHAVEGIRLDLKVDTWPVSINVAMPTGLVVNELLINALKHGFPSGEGGTITLHGLVDDAGCQVIVADDGVGLPEGVDWPQRGKLGALIVQSLKQNANASLDVRSEPGKGMRVTIGFTRAAAAAVANLSSE